MTALPEGFSLRSVTMDDLEVAVDLTNLRSQVLIGEGDMTIARMRMFWQEPERDLSTNNWLITAPDGQPVAYADYSEYPPWDEHGFEFAVHPEFTGRGLEETIVDLVEARAIQSLTKAPEGARVTLQTPVWASNLADQRLLTERGYYQDRVWNRMLIEMDDMPPEPSWPEGISVRTFRPDEVDDVHAAWEDAQRDEYGFTSVTPEEFRTYFIEEEENFDPTLWFLAIDDSTGEIAGYTLNRLERPGEPETAHTRYFAVRRPYRRRGIGQALLQHTFRAFFKRGKRRAGLAVDSTSLTGADRLYERAGMQASHQSIVFVKVLREGNGQGHEGP